MSSLFCRVFNHLRWVLPGFVSFCLFSACIVPPEPRPASVLSQSELDLVSTVKRGKDYVGTGRLDLAEREYRLALRLNDKSDAIYNDLGFLLQGENRFSEAEQMYLRALELKPDNINAHDNLARLYYQSGRVPEALTQYHAVIDLINRADSEKLKEVTGFSPEQALAKVYRKMAGANYALGRTDEALCESRKALQMSGAIPEAGQHARMALSLEHMNEALKVLSDTITVRQANVPPKILLDYGIALYASGDNVLAKTALTRVSSQPTTTSQDKDVVRLLRLAIAISEKNEKEGLQIYDALFEANPEICEQQQIDPDGYWPSAVVDEVKLLLARVCNDERDSLFTS